MFSKQVLQQKFYQFIIKNKFIITKLLITSNRMLSISYSISVLQFVKKLKLNRFYINLNMQLPITNNEMCN